VISDFKLKVQSINNSNQEFHPSSSSLQFSFNTSTHHSQSADMDSDDSDEPADLVYSDDETSVELQMFEAMTNVQNSSKGINFYIILSTNTYFVINQEKIDKLTI
jgi:hypothetical protein